MAESTNKSPIFLLTPKQRMQADERRRGLHNSLVGSIQMLDSVDSALAQYQLKLVRATTDSNAAAANMFKLKGAQEFIAELFSLGYAETPTVVSSPSGQLDHRA